MTKGNRIWTVLSLFAAVLQLIVVRGFDIRQLLLFVVPVLLALLISVQNRATLAPLLAKIFIGLIGLGLLIAKVPWLFPQFGGMDPNLNRESDRALTWYILIYLMFFMCVGPIYIFITNIRDDGLGKPTQISPPTCAMGLVVSIAMLPGIVWLSIEFFHLLPIL
jgi:hypothetical protein